VHRWEKFMEIHNRETDETAREHLMLLVDMLGPETKDSFTALKNIQDTGYVAFEDLSLVYISGRSWYNF
jgi:hypothetical protein